MPKKNKIDTQKEIEDFFKEDDEKIKVEEIKKKVTEKKAVRKTDKSDEEQKKENIEKMLQTIQDNKKIPKDILKNIYSIVSVNLVIAILIMVYLFFIVLGYLNIEKIIYETDLKVLTGLLVGATIILMEISYRKKNKKLTIHSIECLCFAICNLFIMYFYTIFYDKYILIVGLMSIVFGIYYVIKSIVVALMMRRNYLKRMSDVIEILSSDYDKEDFKCQEV